MSEFCRTVCATDVLSLGLAVGTASSSGFQHDDSDHAALTVFFKDTEEGEISRYVYDYFYFTAAAPAGLASLDSMRSKSCIFLINLSTSCGY